MHPEHFLNHLQHNQIVEAIHNAERNTTGEIRVFISHGKVADFISAAQQRFEKLGMHTLPHRNGILIFVAPRSQAFAIIGDRAIHERAGEPAWQALAAGMGQRFKNHQHTEAITFAIERAGELLAANFPK